MDKYEYKLKLDEIETLAGEKNYAAAAEIADGINWRKVRNVNSLMLVGDVYHQTGRFEDAKEILLMAYDRSPIGKKIIYRLTEIAIEAHEFEEAQEYYDEFIEIAPHDTAKYILKYRFSQAKGEPLANQIAILDELKEQEYTEEWAFELAYLYHQAGMIDKCIESCDEIILWFGDGMYVEKALELKMLYQPLTAEQETKYQQFRRQRDGIIEVRPEEYLKSGEIINNVMEIPEVRVNADRFNTQNLQEELVRGMQQIKDATEKETVSDTMESIKRMVGEIPYLQPLLAEEAEKAPAALPPEYETDEEIDVSLRLNFQEMLAEEQDGQISMSLPERSALERQITGQLTIADVLAEWDRTKRAAEQAMENAQARKLESAKVKALQEAGDLMDRLATVMPQLDNGITTRELMEQAYEEATPESMEAAAAAMSDVNERLQAEINRLQSEGESEDQESDVLQTEKIDKEDHSEEISSSEQEEIPIPNEQDDQSQQITDDEDELIGDTLEIPFEEIEERIPAGIDQPEPQQSNVRRELERPGIDKPLRTFPTLADILSRDDFHGPKDDIEADADDETEEEDVESIEKVLSDWERLKDPTTPLPEISMDLFDDTEREPEIVVEQHFKGITKLDAESAKRFSYFSKVDGMETQICKALNECGAYLQSGIGGNLIIEGASGCGKTMLAMNLVKTLQQMTGKPGNQIGKINGDTLNHKDIDGLMGKISGGCLIIEHVGELTRETEGKLEKYISAHPADVFVILEADKEDMEKALKRHEAFASKFVSKIQVPYFTNDELVEFAKTYAAENGYGIDAMAMLALYRRIGNIQKLDQSTTLVEVKEIVDEAISRVEKGGIKKMFGILTAKRYDENNYVVLHEKDFIN